MDLMMLPSSFGLEVSRQLLASVAFLSLSVLVALVFRPHPLLQKKNALRSCQDDVRVMLESSLAHPLFLRLAWSDAASYDDSVPEWPHCGGVNGSVISEKELGLPGNAGLSKAVVLLRDIKSKHPTVSWADLIQMAGALAVELTGGGKIDMKYGRVDALISSSKGALPAFQYPFPDGAQSAETHIRNVFYRMGFTNREIVALCGAHTIGRAFKDRSGACSNVSGDFGATKYTKQTADVRCCGITGGVNIPGGKSWTEKWMCFDNSYFRRSDAGENTDLLWLPTDRALCESPEFKAYYQKYAADQALFLTDYGQAHKKMSELGSKFQPPGGLHIP